MYDPNKKQKVERNTSFGRMSNDVLNLVSEFVPDSTNLASASTGLWNTLVSRNRHKNKTYIVRESNVEGLLMAISEPLVSLEGTAFQVPAFTPVVRENMPELYELAHSIHMRLERGRDHDVPYFVPYFVLRGLKGAKFLHTLELNYNVGVDLPQAYRMGNAGALALTALKDAPCLKTLQLGLGNNGLDGAGLQFLVALKELRELRSLCIDLSDNDIAHCCATGIDADMLTIGSVFESMDAVRTESTKGATALASLNNIPNLEVLELGLGGNKLNTADIEILATLRHAPQLQELEIGLENNCFDNEGLLHIARFRESRRLRVLELNLTYNSHRCQGCAHTGHAPITHVGIRQLVALRYTPVLENLRLRLTIEDNEEGDAVRSLVMLGKAPLLHSLALMINVASGTYIGDIGAQHLAGLNHAHAIRNLYLDLGSNNIGVVGARALGTLNKMHSLTLFLANNPITSLGADGLSKLKISKHLHELDLGLGATDIGDQGAWYLCQLGDIPGIKKMSLRLEGCDIGPDGAVAFGGLQHVPSLCDLSLFVDDNGIGDVGLSGLLELRRAPKLNRLKLGLSNNQIGNPGAAALAMSPSNTTLRHLVINLARNNIGDTGAVFLGALRYAPGLTAIELDVSNNYVSMDGGEILDILLHAGATGTITSVRTMNT
jgi:hypothetical protein